MMPLLTIYNVQKNHLYLVLALWIHTYLQIKYWLDFIRVYKNVLRLCNTTINASIYTQTEEQSIILNALQLSICSYIDWYFYFARKNAFAIYGIISIGLLRSLFLLGYSFSNLLLTLRAYDMLISKPSSPLTLFQECATPS